jgi:hypothetical protein
MRMARPSEAKPGKQEPGIKGSVLKGIVEHALEVVHKRNISAAELERRFGQGGVSMLYGTIASAVWYPIPFYGKLREFLREVEGDGDEHYSIEAGAESARRLILGGMYPQLAHLDGFGRDTARSFDAAEIAARRERFKLQLTRVAGIHGALFNFSTMEPAADPDHADRMQLVYWDFGAMPRDGRLAVLGFWNELAARWSSSKLGLWQKIDREDHYVLRMTRDISTL